MIKRTVAINRIKFALGVILIFLVSYALQINLTVPLCLLSLFLYLKIRQLDLARARLLYLALLFVIIFVTAYFIRKQGWPVFYIPFCAVPMLATLLFNQLEISLLITLATAVAVTSVAGNNFYLAVLFLISGVVSSISVLGSRRRMDIIRTGIIIGLIQAAALFFTNLPVISLTREYPVLILNGIVSGIIILGVLPVFEYLFSTVTNISLLELADFNNPLLQRMIIEAPGTYHHSLMVGNLSEAACQAVGVNALLARIGAYYHDIGKLQKPDYFSENQNIKASVHDSLSPAMSKLVIMSHVKEGVELARKHKLNPPLIDFIQRHHGNSLVYYFYRRALESLEDDEVIKEEGFRYPGPKPHTKETAVVLLADSVEAATRAMKDPAPSKIEEVVHKIINNKFIDGQLDECELTLKDLEKISAVFIRILSGVYHSRITYPEKTTDSGENNHKKSSEESPRQSEKGKVSDS